jgi:hypothetical protein
MNIKTWQHRVKVNGEWEGDAMKLEIGELRAEIARLNAQRPKEGIPVSLWCNIHGATIGYPTCQGCAADSQNRAFEKYREQELRQT